MTDTIPAVAAPKPRKARAETIYRHRLIPRVTHWINLICIALLLMSGAQIFNAHPALYWGQYGADSDPALLEMTSQDDGHGGMIGITRIGPLSLRTTGVLGVSTVQGELTERGFPAWLTLPSEQDLATGRSWHFILAWLFVTNGAVYLIYGALSGHFRRDIAPRKRELSPRHIGRDILDHIRLKHPTGEEAKHYNTLQKFAYLVVIFVLLPTMVLTGLTMSPGMDAIAPGLLTLFGGRQSARTLHFISANLIVLFVLVHVIEVFLAGVFNEMRSMITGWYVVKPETPHERP